MATNMSALFDPFQSGGLSLPNRIVMAPMTRCFSPDGVPGPDVAAYYRRRAENGVGLIVTEGTWIPHAGASNERDVPDFFGDAALAGWKLVVEEVHAAGGRIAPQLWHVGLILKPKIPNIFDDPSGLEERHVGPSGVAGGIGRPLESGRPAMTEADIEAVIDAYATAARSALDLGFDGVELHAAHGYLIDQFFWDRTNLRTDRYGGDWTNRTRFAAEVVAEIRRRTSPDFPIILRISQWKQHDYDARMAHTPADLEAMTRPLVDAGVDLFHCSQRRFWLPEFAGSDMNFAGWTKKVSGRPTITVGSVSLTNDMMSTAFGASTDRCDIDLLIRMLERGDFDLVAVGRGLLADPDWPRRIREGGVAALSPYSSDVLGRLH